MRLAVTVISPAARRLADVVLDADPATLVGEVAAELDRVGLGPSPGNGASAVPSPLAAPGGDGGNVGNGGARVLQFPGPGVRGVRTVTAGNGPVRTAPPVYVDFALVAPQLTLANSVIRDGSVISLGTRRAACGPSRPDWWKSG